MRSFICCLLPLFFVLTLSSCEQKSAHDNEAEKILKSGNGGDFRGINIGDQPSAVINAEEGVSVYSMPDEVVYRMPLNHEDSTWYEISYNFNQNGLYNIDLEIFPKNKDKSLMLRQDLINYYLNKYGECKTESGKCSWRAITQNGHYVSITLTDSVPGKTRPAIKVNFNEFEK